jgi:hypothetical protein
LSAPNNSSDKKEKKEERSFVRSCVRLFVCSFVRSVSVLFEQQRQTTMGDLVPVAFARYFIGSTVKVDGGANIFDIKYDNRIF